MTQDQIAAASVAAITRVSIAFLIYWSYYVHARSYERSFAFRDKEKFGFFFGTAFLLFGLHLFFRSLAILTFSLHWYFLHILCLMWGTVSILQSLKYVGVGSLEKYQLTRMLAIVSVMVAFNDAYFAGGLVAEGDILLRLVTLSVGGVGFLGASYHFNKIARNFPPLGRVLIVSGMFLEGLLHFAAVWLLEGYAALLFLTGMVFMIMVWSGWFVGIFIGDMAFHSTLQTSVKKQVGRRGRKNRGHSND